MTRSYKLDELAQAAGVSPRTVRYYVQRGLLRAPTFRGKDTAYDDDHLAQLRAIRALQDRFLPLDTIQATLDSLDRAALEALVAGAPAPTPPPATTPAQQPRLWRRITLADGLELHVATDAPAQSVRLAEDLHALVTAQTNGER